MRIVGIDASTNKTGISLFVNDKLKEHRVIDCSRIKDADERMREMCLNLDSVLSKWKPDLIACEDTWMNINPKTSKTLARLGGAIWFWAIWHGVEMKFFTPSLWRSAVGIQTGKVKREQLKAQAIAKIEKEFGFTATDDEAEAILIGASVPLILDSDDDGLFE